ncbi:DUF402 domain-containing protein [Amycolatopsis cihanbeyliensis]|uniref:Uncharacterized protein DUF402 n=1 Tax=Amycolatopsis cihanbeyliensis TaxID=1128664 RepID=A0A542DGI4_AMYCI|nr:DUF402 domain-containing protein [Amycolatopsis cihanbeyliensis]TQJ02164.1 uncharacterized protein DUF402 [Amycolatopsis cihanbeyliensis]
MNERASENRSDPRWRVGETAVVRFLRPDGSTGQHHPLRVLADDGRSLLGWLPAGTEIVGTRLIGGRHRRDVPLAERFLLPRERCRDTWRGTSTLRLISEDRWSSVWWFFGAGGEFLGWYGNLEIPLGRGQGGPDRMDGVLDLAVDPDGSWRWKDEDEAEAAVDAGRLTAAQLAALRAEGERLAGLAEAGTFPFDGTWTEFRPEPGWAAPELPAEVRAPD